MREDSYIPAMSIPNPNPLPLITPITKISRTLRLGNPNHIQCRAAADVTGATVPEWFPSLSSRTEERVRSSDEEKIDKSKKKKWLWLWWQRDGESYLSDHSDALPMAYTNSPLGSRTQSADGEDEVYEWTAKCRSCNGTGFASYYRKKGRETICKCVPCQGIVLRMLLRKLYREKYVHG